MTVSNVSIPATTWSAAAWVYPTTSSASAHQWIFGINGSTAGNFKFGICTYKDKLGVRTSNSTYTVSNTHSLNKWYHICVTYNNRLLKIYIDGILKYTNTSVTASSSTNNFYIGIRGGMAGAFHGKINDIRVYNNCISPAEVKEIAQGLVLHYKLDNITNGIVQDSSGYNHNGTINKTLTLSSNTARYSICGYFRAYNTPNIIVNDTSSFAPALSNCTVTWWGKYNTTKTLLFAGQTTSHYIAASNNNTYYHGTVGSNTKTFYKDGVAGSYKCAADGWHFFAITGLDLSTWTTLKLNGYSSAYPLKGYINDLRIYSTILSPDDILALYHTGAKIDNLQNTYTFEYIEDQSLIKVTKQGQIKCDEIIEDTNIKIKKDNTIEAFKFIEL